jgi:hypothetical protein
MNGFPERWIIVLRAGETMWNLVMRLLEEVEASSGWSADQSLQPASFSLSIRSELRNHLARWLQKR